MLKLSKIEKEILDLLLSASPKATAQKLNVDIQKVYSTKHYFLCKVQNAEEFLAVAKSKYKPLIRRRLNTPKIMPLEDEEEEILKVNVDYDVTQVEVNDLVTVSVELEFNPPVEMEAGMVVLDVSVPTGFAPVIESITEVVDDDDNIKRYEVAGRKVIFYIENMFPGDRVSFEFQVKALYPVKAKSVSSQAYSYYKPEIKGETLSQELSVSE